VLRQHYDGLDSEDVLDLPHYILIAIVSQKQLITTATKTKTKTKKAKYAATLASFAALASLSSSLWSFDAKTGL
jgi:hypothetical protein